MQIERLSGFAAVSGMVFSLMGCGHMPITTMVKLRNFDMAAVDPAVLRAAVRLPEALEPKRGAARLEISWWTRGKEGEKELRRIPLELIQSPSETQPLAREARRGFRVHVYRIPQDRIAALRELQAKVRERREKEPGKISGNLKVAADACRRNGLPRGRLDSTSWILPDRATGYVPLIVDYDLRGLAPDASKLLEALPPCGKWEDRADG